MIKVALVGNPNCGKSTVFNLLTKSRQKIANYPGVTVEKKEGFGRFFKKKLFYFVDLPGVYNLTSHSKEEKITRNYILDENPDILINIIDSSNLERSLYLTLQLMELKKPIILVCNKMDIAKAHNININIEKLSLYLEILIVEMVASKKSGLDKLLRAIEIIQNKNFSNVSDGIYLKFSKKIEDAIEKIMFFLKDKNCDRWHAIKILEKDEYVLEKMDLYEPDKLVFLEKFFKYKDFFEENIRKETYFFLEGILKNVLEKKGEKKFFTDKLDRFLTHKFFGIFFFFIFMYCIFHLTFFFGSFVSNALDLFFEKFYYLLFSIWQNESFFRSLFLDGIFRGISSIIIFLPNILFLFIFLSFLEESGYMARAAFVMDRIMHKIGLHGKSFLPMLIGFGCSVPAVMSTRILENKRDRLSLMLALPFIPCSAKLFVFALVIPAFFSFQIGALILFLLYFFGIFLSIFFIKILRKYIFKGKSIPFIMELPLYQFPSLKRIFKNAGIKAVLYLRKAGGIILFISIIFWFLSSFPKNENIKKEVNKAFFSVKNETVKKINLLEKDKDFLVEKLKKQINSKKLLSNFYLHLKKDNEKILQIEKSFNDKVSKIRNEYRKEILYGSYIGRMGRFIEPVFRPLGFDWKINTAFLGALFAKEAFVSQLNIIFSIDSKDIKNFSLKNALKENYSKSVAISILLFILISSPCFATVFMTKKESKSYFLAFFQFFFLSFFAYIIAFLVYTVSNAVIHFL